MSWPGDEVLSAMLVLPEGYRGARLQRSEIPALVADDREMVAPGVEQRVYEAFYAKVLVPDEDLLRPDPENLSPKARALFDVIFLD